MGKIGVFHKKEGPFCTAFTTGRWRLYCALMLTQVCRGEGTGSREGIAGRPISVGASRRERASGGRARVDGCAPLARRRWCGGRRFRRMAVHAPARGANE